MVPPPVRLDDRLLARARILARISGALVMLAGFTALVGWAFDVAVLKGVYGGITMKANAAISLVLAGGSLLLLNARGQRLWTRRAGQGSASLICLIGGATFSQHLLGWNLGIDEMLFREPPGALGTTSPGRMGPPASISFVLAGVALLLLYAGRSASLAQVASAAIGLAALLAVTGYAYGVETLYGVALYTGIALHTALALLVLSAGILASSVDRGVASILVGEGAGSLMVRRLLAFAVLVPLLLGLLRIRLEAAGWFDARFGIAALVIALIVTLTAVIVRTGVMLNRIERHKLAAEADLRDRLQEIESMMEVLPIGIFMATDPLGRHIIGNLAAREFLRMPAPGANLSLTAPRGEAPGHFRVFRGGIELGPEDLPVQRAAREGTASQDLELEVVFSDGVVKHLLINALPLLGADGRPRGAVASLMDITARKAADEEREELLVREREAHLEAEAAHRARDEFLAVIAHELRTPLNAILGWASMLRDGTLSNGDSQRGALAAIERSCKSQAQLIEDLLEDSRIVGGRLELNVQRVDLTEVVGAAVDAVRPAAAAKGIGLQVTLDHAVRSVNGDPRRLQQVVSNLLTNSVKFSGGGGHIEVRLAAEGPDAVITVTDQGEGIPPEFLPHVFDRFRQVHPSREQRRGGLGLGLSIARQLVEMHGGRIEAASEGAGRGARFTVRLPLLATEAAEPANPTAGIGG